MSEGFIVVGLPPFDPQYRNSASLARAEMRAEMNHAKEADTAEIVSNPSSHFTGCSVTMSRKPILHNDDLQLESVFRTDLLLPYSHHFVSITKRHFFL